MDISDADLCEICERLINATVTQDQLNQTDLNALQLTERVVEIVLRNLASGRAQRVMDNCRNASTNANASLEQYIDKVIVRYLAERQRVERLAERDDAEWAQLLELMTTRAYRILYRWQVNDLQSKDIATDFAQQTCESIYAAVFPYDVSFDAWATVILSNHIRQHYTRSQDLIDRNPLMESLDLSVTSDPDEMTSLYETLSDPTAAHLFERIDVQQEIIDAIAQLPSHTQQDVIVYSYLYGWSDEQIASHLGKTKQAIYNLRHRALRQLRQVFKEMRLQDV
ncbi:hypothetical protein TFLX_03987 [Thermoflexales bacterium]|nr:hypothetical protein TFLX_03987 [Thermoflexales bacterium]